MANLIGQERIVVKSARKSSSETIVTIHAKSALFYFLGPPVLYFGLLGDGTLAEGIPFWNGGHIVVSGEQSIKKAQFRTAPPRSTEPSYVYALYFDEPFDIRDFSGGEVKTRVEGLLRTIEAQGVDILAELKRHTAAWNQGVDHPV